MAPDVLPSDPLDTSFTYPVLWRGFLYNPLVRRIFFLICLLYFPAFAGKVLAISDPLAVPNNKIGIHILFPGEIYDAAKIVNNKGEAAWGYVVIPIQAKDRDRQRWQDFLDKCKENKVIPIIRVATVAEGSNWATPNNYDLVDFANFLNDLKWPVRNRYVIIFNEVNRSDEYGGVISPENYADILNNAVDLFKARSSDFFILPAGLDNAASSGKTSINWKAYLRRMYQKQPDIFNKIDGWTSHAYPNPDFSARPDLSGSNRIDSFKYDLQVLKNFTNKKLPIFITEAGWSGKYLSDHQISLYYQYAFSKVWTDPSIVAITPFVLDAQDGPFKQFSFVGKNQEIKEFVSTYASFAQSGDPALSVDLPPQIAFKEETAEEPAVLGTQTDARTLLQKLYNNLMSLFGLIK